MSEVPDRTEASGEPPRVQGPADLRCSDVDRDRVSEALRQAAGDGRLTLTELEERLEATFKAKTYGDLQPITRDLPQGPYPLPGGGTRWAAEAAGAADIAPALGSSTQPAQRIAGGAAVPNARVVSVLGDSKRNGRWEVPERLDVSVFLGEVTLDFTEAIVRTSEVVIQAAVVLGNLTIIVPEGIDVRIGDGVNVLGDRKVKMREPVTPGGPVYHVRGFVVLGEVTVRPPREKRRSLLH